ncbi:MAG TPA: hypothetical protein VNW94_08345 [Streptosporangiaceae bacterium]|nr:hypothetical protein [Streptosporangiaceae bacterium]
MVGTETTRRSDLLSLTAMVLVVIAACGAAWFGWSWYSAAHDSSLSYSRVRDTVLRAGEQGVQNMNTLDYRNVNEGLSRWEQSSTGALNQELVAGTSTFMVQVQQARTISTAKILDGAVKELDEHAGQATVVVAVQITLVTPDGKSTIKENRMLAQLTRTPSGWKLSALGSPPVGG